MPNQKTFKAIPTLIILLILSFVSFFAFQSYNVTENRRQDGRVRGTDVQTSPIPTHPNAQIVNQNESATGIFFTIRIDTGINAVKQWYKEAFENEGWNVENEYIFTRNGERVEVSLLDNKDGTTIAIINYSY